MVRPVDLQDNLSKTQLLEKVHQLQKATPEEAQKQFSQELQKKIAEGKERVTDSPKSDKIIINRDEKREEEKKRQAKKENDDDNKDEQSSEDKSDSQKGKSKKIDYIA